MHAEKLVEVLVLLSALLFLVDRVGSRPLSLEDSKSEEPTVPRIKLSDRITLYGDCKPEDHLLHAEDLQIENQGPSTLSGSFEFTIDFPARITCVEIADRGDVDSLSSPVLSSGGPGHKWLSVKVKGLYGKGIFVFVRIAGVPQITRAIRKQSDQRDLMLL